jgi:hypothetical protein
MEATDPWKPLELHPHCPVCARRATAERMRPSVQRVEDGAEVEADVLRGASLIAAAMEIDELPDTDDDVVAIRIPRLLSDDVIQLRIPRACIETPSRSDAVGPWARSARLANAVVLPQRWYLLEASLPTVVSRTASGCTRIEFDAPSDEDADVILTVVRHSLATAV